MNCRRALLSYSSTMRRTRGRPSCGSCAGCGVPLKQREAVCGSHASAAVPPLSAARALCRRRCRRRARRRWRTRRRRGHQVRRTGSRMTTCRSAGVRRAWAPARRAGARYAAQGSRSHLLHALPARPARSAGRRRERSWSASRRWTSRPARSTAAATSAPRGPPSSTAAVRGPVAKEANASQRWRSARPVLAGAAPPAAAATRSGNVVGRSVTKITSRRSSAHFATCARAQGALPPSVAAAPGRRSG